MLSSAIVCVTCIRPVIIRSVYIIAYVSIWYIPWICLRLLPAAVLSYPADSEHFASCRRHCIDRSMVKISGKLGVGPPPGSKGPPGNAGQKAGGRGVTPWTPHVHIILVLACLVYFHKGQGGQRGRDLRGIRGGKGRVKKNLGSLSLAITPPSPDTEDLIFTLERRSISWHLCIFLFCKIIVSFVTLSRKAVCSGQVGNDAFSGNLHLRHLLLNNVSMVLCYCMVFVSNLLTLMRRLRLRKLVWLAAMTRGHFEGERHSSC